MEVELINYATTFGIALVPLDKVTKPFNKFLLFSFCLETNRTEPHTHVSTALKLH